MSVTHLNVYLGQELKDRWKAYCQARSLQPSSAIRASIQAEIERLEKAGKGDEPAKKFKQQAESPDEGAKCRLEIRLTPSEGNAVKQLAKLDDCSPQSWIINAIRASLTHEPQFTMEPVRALWDSSSQLRAISRDLKQIAKWLKEGEKASLTVEQINKLASYIQQHTEKVSIVVAASLNRWRII